MRISFFSKGERSGPGCPAWIGAASVMTLAGVALGQCPQGWMDGVGGLGCNSSPYAWKMVRLPVSGDVAVCGSFSRAGSVTAVNVARFRPSDNSWRSLGEATPWSSILSMAVLPGDDLCAAGYLAGGGSVVAHYDAANNGWAPFRYGPNGSVQLLQVLPGGDVMMAGGFSIVFGSGLDPQTAHNIAILNPTTGVWDTMGAGVPASSGGPYFDSSVVLPGGDVIIGGRFPSAGGLTVNNIARYSPATGAWSALGSGIYDNGRVFALALLPGGDLIAGGEFEIAGGTPAPGIARYSFASGAWSGMGWPWLGQVRCLLVLQDGDIIAGGPFGQTDVIGIARYHAGVWSALDGGVSGDGVNAMLLLPSGRGDLIVGGRFTRAGRIAASAFARYSTGACNCGPADFDGDGDVGTDSDIEAFFACLAGSCCPACGPADFNGDGDVATDADIEAFFRVLAGGSC